MGKVLSIHISGTEIRVCELEQSGKNVTVSRAYDSPIPAGLIEDGVILDMDAVAGALAKTLSDNGTKKGQLAFTLLSKKIAQKEIQLPYVKDEKKVGDMISANLSEYFPMNNLGDYVIRHNILDTIEVEGEKRLAVQVWAFPKGLIESYNTLASMIKMPLLTIDYYYNSVYQLLRKQMTGAGTTLAIQMSRHNTQVSIMNGRIQQFKRPIAYGKSTLISNLMEYRNIVKQDAEMALTDPQYQEHMLPLADFQELIHNFAMSVTRVVEYHTSKNPNVNVEAVKLFGTGACIPNFALALGQELGVDVESIREFQGVKINRKKQKDLTYDLLQEYMANLGVLFGSLDVKLEEKKKKSGFGTIMLLSIIGVALVYAGVWAFLFFQGKALDDEKDSLSKQISALEPAEGIFLSYEQLREAFDEIDTIYNDTKNASEMLSNFIGDLEANMPASVEFTNIAVQDGSVNITGTCGGKESLSALIIELKKLPYVRNVWVASASDSGQGSEKKTAFNLSLSFVYMDSESVEAELTDQRGQEENEEDLSGLDVVTEGEGE